MPQETEKDRRARAATKVLNEAAASLRARTSQTISAGHLDQTQTVPPRSRYTMAALLEALAHEVARHRLSQRATDEAVTLARAILDEDHDDPQ